MKLYWIILFGFVISIPDVFTATTNDTCNPDDWILTNTTLNWTNNTKLITGNIAYNSCANCSVYAIRIEISDCVNRTTCYGQPMVGVDNVNCNSSNLSNSDLEACKIAQEVGTLEQQQEWITNANAQLGTQGLYTHVFCIDTSNASSDGDGSDKQGK
ncbi:hypothetical protein DMN91_010594 [Ooceraea biroi]|uniref:Uncharacterized protein n=1 Tax=Ooceraea biroi TaxID=2015173 RepID=A0A3L8D8B7_OOCBI|nr:uncharacterized protein LOC105282945 [Ooceraea biroi]RLU16526.1 hypothetical protein DMN91_010594 [Ooceraea biroi]